MNRLYRVSLSALIMVLMVATSFVVLTTPAAATPAPSDVIAPRLPAKEGALGGVELRNADLPALSQNEKIDKILAERMKNSMGPFKVYVLVTDKDAVNSYLARNGLPTVDGYQIQGLPLVRVMDLYSTHIAALSKNTGVFKIMVYEPPVYDVAPLDPALEGADVELVRPVIEDFDVDYLHGATDAWADGYTGYGIKIAVIDTGFDMAHPDLLGQQARYEDPASPYFGWPIAYDDRAAYYWYLGMIGGWVADTSATSADLGGYVTFDGRTWDIAGLKDVWGTPVMSQSGVYHIGYHTDENLMSLWGDYIGVLVVDSVTPGVYDTVYVDIDHDMSFSDEKACTKGDETAYYDYYDSFMMTENWDAWNGGDGYPDLSGGMVYWISDGVHVLPGTDWLYGATFTAGPGDAVGFVGEFGYGQNHGTMTSSAALGTGASFYGLLTGMAPDAKLIAIPMTNDYVASWLFAEFGADGVPNTGDEANIVSNSYGFSDTAISAGYEIWDLYTSYISLIGGQTLWFWSTGNGGPGLGTSHSPIDFTAVHCGASTTMQYRYWLGYEEYYEYTTWGDMAPFSNAGPTRNGKLNAEISASGMYSMEPAPLNQPAYGGLGDGFVHFQIGSGTSHATPTVAGGAALGFQAYYDVYGDMPYIDYAKAVLMASADDMHYDPLKQGAGWLNAATYARLMGEYDGVMTIDLSGPVLLKAALYPGTDDGTASGTPYEVWPNFLLPGESYSHYLSTMNNNPFAPADVTITSEMLIRTGSDRIDFVTPHAGSLYFDIRPMVPAGTDLVKITWFMPLDEFDPELDYASNVRYYLEVHDWVDTNGDGVMNITGGEWELYRYSVDGSDCNYNQVTVRDPLDRSHDGLIVRVRSIAGAAGLDMSLQMDYYDLQPFPWIQFRQVGDPFWLPALSMTVGPWSWADWEALVSVPWDAPVGTYSAAIYVDDGTRVQCLPVVINVPATDYEFSFGGWSYFDTIYNNDFTGIADKGWRFDVGDWRMYWSLPTSAVPNINSHLIVTVGWSDLPTDVNVHVLVGIPGWGWPSYAPPFGPDMVAYPVASSDENYLGAGTFGVGTSTGGPMEVIAAPLGMVGGGPMPFAIVTRCPVMDGYEASDTLWGYTTWLTMNGYAPTEIELGQWGWAPNPGSVSAWYDITVAGFVEARGSGLGPLQVSEYPSQEIWQDVLTGDFLADLANAAYQHVFSVAGSSMLEVSVREVFGCPDIDLGLWYDSDMDGVADLTEPYWYVGIFGSTESITLDMPLDGQYIVKVLGYTVTGMPGLFDLTVSVGVPGYIYANMWEGWVSSGYHDFSVEYQVPYVSGTYTGQATFGFMGAADMFAIDVIIHIDADPPEITDVSPAHGENVGTNSVVVSFTATDDRPTDSGMDWWSSWVSIDATWTFGPWSSAWQQVGDTVYIAVPTFLSDGSHTLVVYVYDRWSNSDMWVSTFWINSRIETFTAQWYDPSTGMPIIDGKKVALTEVGLRGVTDPLSQITVYTPTDVYMTGSKADGSYDFPAIALSEGLNVATVEVVNNASVSASMLKMLVRDTFCMLWVDPIASPTTDATVDVHGWTDGDAAVTVNGLPVPVNPDGTFGASVILSEGLNLISIEAVDSVGNSASRLIDVELDTTPPALTVTGPSDGSNTSQPNILVWGTTEAGATVWVNGVVASDGTTDWAATVALTEGMNTIVVSAEDALGNGISVSVSVEYIPPVYVTPEELQAVQDALMGLIGNLTASLEENASVLQAQIDALAGALAENVSALQGDLADIAAALSANVSALQAQINAITAEIAALEAALAENVTQLRANIDALQDAIDAANADIASLEAALAENVTALQTADADQRAALQENITMLQGEIDAANADLAALQTALQENMTELRNALTTNATALSGQIAALSSALDALEADLQSQMDALQDAVDAAQEDAGDAKQTAEDVDSFASMLMYLTLMLFAIAIILIGLVWYMAKGRSGGQSGGGSAESLEEVEETASEVEQEFAKLEKEIEKEEM
ncbi:MAG: S8 family serine peptidase [Thermoplasmata archaeon]